MLVYHGTDEVVYEPSALVNETDDLDFGYGFYVTTSYETACDWAESRAAEHLGSVPIVNTYELDDAYAYDKRALVFEDTTIGWFNFIVKSRNPDCDPTYQDDKYDIVAGKVANDDGSITLDDLDSGAVDAEQAFADLIAIDLGDQICLRTDDVISRYLSFIDYDEL